jgi:molecular chaperone GrpE
MTTERRPAGTPADWVERQPAGSPASDDDADGLGAEVEQDLDALLADVKRERDEYLELAKRARADFENFRKRAAGETADAERRGKVSIARELVPALDNLERALRSAGIDPDAVEVSQDGPLSEEVTAHQALARGVALVYAELLGTLQRAGVERFDPTGERFDPAWHEALSTRGDDGAEAGVVLETVEKGYRLRDQLIRPARVVVSQ